MGRRQSGRSMAGSRTLTNNSNRVAPTATPSGSQLKPDTANPRYYEDLKSGTTSQKGNPNGHIIRWREAGNDPAATTFAWDIYLFAPKQQPLPSNPPASPTSTTSPARTACGSTATACCGFKPMMVPTLTSPTA